MRPVGVVWPIGWSASPAQQDSPFVAHATKGREGPRTARLPFCHTRPVGRGAKSGRPAPRKRLCADARGGVPAPPRVRLYDFWLWLLPACGRAPLGHPAGLCGRLCRASPPPWPLGPVAPQARRVRGSVRPRGTRRTSGRWGGGHIRVYTGLLASYRSCRSPSVHLPRPCAMASARASSVRPPPPQAHSLPHATPPARVPACPVPFSPLSPRMLHVVWQCRLCAGRVPWRAVGPRPCAPARLCPAMPGWRASPVPAVAAHGLASLAGLPPPCRAVPGPRPACVAPSPRPVPPCAPCLPPWADAPAHAPARRSRRGHPPVRLAAWVGGDRRGQLKKAVSRERKRKIPHGIRRFHPANRPSRR